MSYDSVILADNPTAYWKCEELTPPAAPPNTAFIDSSGNGFNGTLQPNSVAGLIQGLSGPILTDAVSYAEGGGLARIPSLGPNTGDLFITGAQTWECWFKLAGSAVHMLMNRGGDATNTYLSVGQRSTGLFTTHVVASLDWGGDLRGLISCELQPDTWYMAHLTYDGVDTMSLYLNSWLSTTRSDCPPAPLTDTEPWRIGYATNLVFGAVFLNYIMSHVAIYDYVLTPEQMAAHNIAALGERAENPCGDTILLGCPANVGQVGEPYSSTFEVTGGTEPFTFAITSGALPDGLTLNTVTGEITGTPTVASTFNFEASVTDADGLVGFTGSPGCQIVTTDEPPPGPTPVRTVTFDSEGLGNPWWIALQLTDSGDELRDKCLKPFRVTGKGSDRAAKFYAYGPLDDINVRDVEDGINFTAEQDVPDATTQVQRCPRLGLNVPNATNWTCRLEGEWDGTGMRDRVDEISIEVAKQGIRR